MIKTIVVVVALFSLIYADNLSPGGTATRYWDCCKPSGANTGKAAVNQPVYACAQDGVTHVDPSTQSACQGGSAYTCNNYQPFVSSCNPSLSFAFGARAESNDESSFECACYQVVFNELPGKTLIVQATNDGGDVPATNFDINIPGGGVGIFDACSAEYGAPSGGWGAQYGGISSADQCSQLPGSLSSGCNWRFSWFYDNPTIASISRVQCPTELVQISGCIRNDDSSQPPASVGCDGSYNGGGGGGGGGGAPPPPPPPPPPPAPAPQNGGGGGCSGQWGQCGGQNWSGPTCCSAGSCQSQNPWYSQCL